MARYADQAQARWQDGDRIDLAREMNRLALGIAGKTLFNADVLDQASDLGAHLTFAMRHAMRQMDSPVRLVPGPSTGAAPAG